MKIGFLQLLTVVFIVLKLCKVITWSWWIVFSPILAPLSLAAFLFTLSLLIRLFIRAHESPEGRNRRELLKALEQAQRSFR